MSRKLLQVLPRVFEGSQRGAHNLSFGKGVNYFPALSKHGRPTQISQGSGHQRNERSSMSDPDMYYNYTPTFAAAESGKQQLGAVSRAAFPQTVHVPEGGRPVSTPDYPEPNRNSLTDADHSKLSRNMWPRKNIPNQIPHVTSAKPQPLQNSMADAEYVDTRQMRQ